MSEHYGRRDVLRMGAAAFAAGSLLSAGNASATMYLDTPPKVIETRIFTQMPNEFRRKGVRSAWADANKGAARLTASSKVPPSQPTAPSTSPIFPSAGYSGSRPPASGR